MNICNCENITGTDYVSINTWVFLVVYKNKLQDSYFAMLRHIETIMLQVSEDDIIKYKEKDTHVQALALARDLFHSNICKHNTVPPTQPQLKSMLVALFIQIMY